MTELQIGLIGLGLVAVAGVVVYNTWQEYRHRKLARELLNENRPDVLFGAPSSFDGQSETVRTSMADTEGPIVPVFHASENQSMTTPGERIEPVLNSESDPELPPRDQVLVESFSALDETAPLPVEVREVSGTLPIVTHGTSPLQVPVELRTEKEVSEFHHLLSPVIDYIAVLESAEALPAERILAVPQAALSRLRKPVYWIGYNERSREWEALVDDGESEFRKIRIGLQLVDRQGPVAEVDLSLFHTAMTELADDLMAIVDLPPAHSVLQAAADLDVFCAGVDIQIGVNVISQDQPFAGTKLRALAEAAGMVIDSEGRFVRCDEEGNVLYLLLNQDEMGFSPEAMKNLATRGLTFLMDVPRVAHGERVFNQMVDLARRFAEVLRGSLVDDNRRPLSEGTLDPIRRQVAQFQAAMAARGLPAGGPLARRLFS
jgi:FtsZ-interacting cell division protein ZipA